MAEVKGFKEVPVGDERALAAAVYKVGPVSVGIDAALGTFQFYQKGPTGYYLQCHTRTWS